ncbi:hypothetical protein KC343_g8553 [Hortaea werneckii]|uniref:RRM domain-containing protein n=1 Tax=Hortaea werneckii TaxID=91943 RepID=A0A3M7GBP0_HORWE|nr:hypothetical protein KC352_g21250 [Hortaea werneckii]KAI7557316.1 hypothetical protein KC317_g11705 [Hortaea werneckii]KAI7612380.1 hypothetical protein KC346_g7859 [Hortaea werneckii]KAI7619921.1 hypothetical protein KC343_g8553 [Hortaea werneckii]KAI7644193.1 hypothetical protein KC319_g12381 [Hortaea werneckii]
MAYSEKVTVDKAYFDALLRRANLHTSAQPLDRPDPVNVTVARTEYDSLLRISKEYELLKSALFQGGITAETLDILISGAGSGGTRKDSGASGLKNGPDGFESQQPAYHSNFNYQNEAGLYQDVHWRRNGSMPSSSIFRDSNPQQTQAGATLQVPSLSRHASYGAPPSSVLDDSAFDEDEDDDDNMIEESRRSLLQPPGLHPSNERRTLYFTGFSDRTTYKDFVSVIKGGQLLSINLRPERSGTVTFLDGAEAFLAWVRRHDIYLHSKRIEVKWADRQYRLNHHIHHKILHGATRNLIIRHARSHGVTAAQIRADLDHIHNLVIIDISFRPPASLSPSTTGSGARDGDDAYVETNAVHNALFARTCLMSRTAYKGCRIEFFPDQCAAPLPVPAIVSRSSRGGLAQWDPLSQSQLLKMSKGRSARVAGPAGSAAKGGLVRNRFEVLEVGDGDGDEQEEEEDEGGESDEDEVSMGVVGACHLRRRRRRRLSQASDGDDGYDDEETTTPGHGVRLGPEDSGTED